MSFYPKTFNKAQAEHDAAMRAEYRRLDVPTSGYFEVQLEVIKETEKAICFNKYNGYLEHVKEAWVPKSQTIIVDLGAEAGKRYFVKNWLAKNFK